MISKTLRHAWICKTQFWPVLLRIHVYIAPSAFSRTKYAFTFEWFRVYSQTCSRDAGHPDNVIESKRVLSRPFTPQRSIPASSQRPRLPFSQDFRRADPDIHHRVVAQFQSSPGDGLTRGPGRPSTARVVAEARIELHEECSLERTHPQSGQQPRSSQEGGPSRALLSHRTSIQVTSFDSAAAGNPCDVRPTAGHEDTRSAAMDGVESLERSNLPEASQLPVQDDEDVGVSQRVTSLPSGGLTALLSGDRAAQGGDFDVCDRQLDVGVWREGSSSVVSLEGNVKQQVVSGSRAEGGLNSGVAVEGHSLAPSLRIAATLLMHAEHAPNVPVTSFAASSASRDEGSGKAKHFLKEDVSAPDAEECPKSSHTIEDALVSSSVKMGMQECVSLMASGSTGGAVEFGTAYSKNGERGPPHGPEEVDGTDAERPCVRTEAPEAEAEACEHGTLHAVADVVADVHISSAKGGDVNKSIDVPIVGRSQRTASKAVSCIVSEMAAAVILERLPNSTQAQFQSMVLATISLPRRACLHLWNV
jgi:hypothetical protein